MEHCATFPPPLLILIIICLSWYALASTPPQLTSMISIASGIKTHGSFLSACIKDRALFERAFERLSGLSRFHLFYMAFIAKYGNVHEGFTKSEMRDFANHFTWLDYHNLGRFAKRSPERLRLLQTFFRQNPDLIPPLTQYPDLVIKMWLTSEQCAGTILRDFGHYDIFMMVKKWGDYSVLPLYSEYVSVLIQEDFLIKSFVTSLFLVDDIDGDYVRVWLNVIKESLKRLTAITNLTEAKDLQSRMACAVELLRQHNDLSPEHLQQLSAVIWHSKFIHQDVLGLFIDTAMRMQAHNLVQLLFQTMHYRTVYNRLRVMDEDDMQSCLPVIDADKGRRLYRASIFHHFHPSKPLQRVIEKNFKVENYQCQNIPSNLLVPSIVNVFDGLSVDILIRLFREILEQTGIWFTKASLKLVCKQWNQVLSGNISYLGGAVESVKIWQKLRMAKYGHELPETAIVEIKTFLESLSEQDMEQLDGFDMILDELKSTKHKIVDCGVFARMIYTHSKSILHHDELVIPIYYSANETVLILYLLHTHYDCLDKFKYTPDLTLLDLLDTVISHQGHQTDLLARALLHLTKSKRTITILALLMYSYSEQYSPQLIDFLVNGAFNRIDSASLFYELVVSYDDPVIHQTLYENNKTCYRRFVIDTILKRKHLPLIHDDVLGVLRECILNKSFTLDDFTLVCTYFSIRNTNMHELAKQMIDSLGRY